MGSPSKQKAKGSTAGKAASAPRSRRRLTYKSRPLEGKSFYLHLRGRKTNAAELERKLRDLGGTIEKFLSKDVSCVVTDQSQSGKSPRTRVNPTSVIQGRTPTRAQVILQKAAKQYSTSSTDVLRNAQIWQIEIKPVERVLKWIESQAAGQPVQSREQEVGSKGKARMLRGAFIKVEDRSRKYKPLFKELTSWPRLNLDAPPGHSPFDEPVAMRTRARSSSKSPRSQLPGNTAVRPQENVPRQRQTSKRGYCELCDVTFKSLRSHVVGKEHRSNASKGDRFAGVDRLIRRGRTLEEFVADVRTRKASSNKETKSTSAHSRTPVRSPRTTKDNNRSKSQTPQNSPRVTPVKIVRFKENQYSVVRTKRNRSSSDNNPTSSRLSKRRRQENYTVVQSTPTTIRLRRRTRLRLTSS